MKLNTTNLVTGQKEEVTVSNSIGKVLWVVISVMLFAFAQQVLGFVSNKTKLDTTIEPIISTPTSAAVFNGPTYAVY